MCDWYVHTWQRPHHLVKFLAMSTQTAVFCARGWRAPGHPIPGTALLSPRRLISSRLEAFPPVRAYNRKVRSEVVADFCATPADIHIYSQMPSSNRIDRRMVGHLVYDCLDDWSAFSGVSPAVDVWEREVCNSADEIWVVSRHLERKLQKHAAKLKYVPNGVDYDHFAGARSYRSRDDGRAPRAIYVGALEDWFDARLLGDAAASLPDWEFHLVGPVNLSSEQRASLALPNVTLRGRRPYRDLPRLLGESDVALIPFTINDLIKGTSPIKLFEYLAAGLPVVSTLMPEVVPYAAPGVVALGDDGGGFAEAIVRQRVEAAPDQCQAVARTCSWDRRFGEALGAKTGPFTNRFAFAVQDEGAAQASDGAGTPCRS